MGADANGAGYEWSADDLVTEGFLFAGYDETVLHYSVGPNLDAHAVLMHEDAGVSFVLSYVTWPYYAEADHEVTEIHRAAAPFVDPLVLLDGDGSPHVFVIVDGELHQGVAADPAWIWQPLGAVATGGTIDGAADDEGSFLLAGGGGRGLDLFRLVSP